MILLEPLEHLARPWGQAGLVALGGTLFLWARCVRIAAVLLSCAGLWLVLCATPAFALMLQRGLTQTYPAMPAADYSTADVIVVLGGGAIPDSDEAWDSDTSDIEATRVGFGLQLFRAARAPRMLLSGGHHAAAQMAQQLQQQGVPSTALLTENASATTYQNALYSAAILKRRGWRHVLLVTSSMHMSRAVASFRRQGLSVIPAPSLGSDRPVRRVIRGVWPQRAAIFLSARCLHEYVGHWIYQLRGWA